MVEILSSSPSVPRENAEEDNVGFFRPIHELSGHFYAEEEKVEPLSERLATILDASL